MPVAPHLPVQLPAFGLLIAGIMALANVLMEVARKKAVAGRLLVPVTFWCHVFDTLVFGLAWGCRWWRGYGFSIHDTGVLLGIGAIHLSPLATYLTYLVTDLLLLGLANWLFFKALQEAAMSTAVPFLAFTPVLLIPTGFVLLGELPGMTKLLGVLLATIGAVMMHRRFFAFGWLTPIKAIYENKGSRYMLYVSLLLALSTPIDKKLTLMTDIYTQCVIYGVGMCVFFLVMSAIRRERLRPALKDGLTWIALAGCLDAATMLLQFASYRYIDVVIVISIKRSGIVLAVVFGWLFFRERNIRDKLVAASVMFIGVTILYLPLTLLQATITAVATLTLMSLFSLYAAPAGSVGPNRYD